MRIAWQGNFALGEFSGKFTCESHALLQKAEGTIIHRHRAKLCANIGNFLIFQKIGFQNTLMRR